VLTVNMIGAILIVPAFTSLFQPKFATTGAASAEETEEKRVQALAGRS